MTGPKITPGADGLIRLHIKFRDRKTLRVHNVYLRTDWVSEDMELGFQSVRQRWAVIGNIMNCDLLAIYAISDEVISITRNGCQQTVLECLGCEEVTEKCEVACPKYKNRGGQ